MASHYAHTLPDRGTADWEPLEQHLNNVADLAGEFAAGCGFADDIAARQWGHLLGQWHDLGKYSNEFQAYLASQGPAASCEASGRRGSVDHSTAGAQHAMNRCRGMTGRILAYCVAGHHGGLADAVDMHGQSDLSTRLKKPVCDYSAAPPAILDLPAPARPPIEFDRTDRSEAAFQIASFCRMLFSCLVDADYLATEGFMQRERGAARARAVPAIAELLPHLDAHLEQLASEACKGPVNRSRAAVLAQCRVKAELRPGLFSLTVPTGGGKTLSSLAFALRHAVRHNLRRVIYAIPFTSIIEQNAKVFRKALEGAGPGVVLEHHSNFEPSGPEAGERAESEPQTPWHRLAVENWDAPLVVTTNVQLFESLFANKPSRCRKLHRIARSVIILDECQTLPVTLLTPTLAMLRELCRAYGCTVVLCTATQPALQFRDDFRIGLTHVREIVDTPDGLYESLRRVQATMLGRLDDKTLIAALRERDQVLCIVNTRAHAARLFTGLREEGGADDAVFHLSAQMCPRHRSVRLDHIRRRLERDQPCRVISTQLIEAGVDIDFPVVYRALAGLDSIAQAAGRCNREGRRPRGDVFVFETYVKPTHAVKHAAQLAAEVAGGHDDLLSISAIEHFFRLMYWSRSDEWDKEEIMGCFSLSGGGHFQFREAAEKYRLIQDAQQPVVVPYGARGRRLAAQLRAMPDPPGRHFAGQLQRYSVGVYERQLNHLRENHSVAQYHERFWVLENEAAYDEQVGLRTDAAGFDPETLCM